MVPLIINPIYTFDSGYLLGPNPLLKGSNRGVQQRGALHPYGFPQSGQCEVKFWDPNRPTSGSILVPFVTVGGCYGDMLPIVLYREGRDRVL